MVRVESKMSFVGRIGGIWFRKVEFSPPKLHNKYAEGVWRGGICQSPEKCRDLV